MIPKIIHYCWLSNDEIPDKMKQCMESWKRKLPDYEFIKWDLNKFDITSSDWCHEAYLNKKYAYACDYIRLYAVYNYGGIYMDMDIEVVKPFDDLLNKEYMFAYEDENKTGIEAGVFGAEPRNAFLGYCLNFYEGKHFVDVQDILFKYTLPKVMKACLEKGSFEYNLYNHYTFTAKSYHTGEITIKENTYTIHHFEGTWRTEKERDLHEKEKYYKQKYGVLFGRNIVEYESAWKEKGLLGLLSLTILKIRKKIKVISKGTK